jgi:BlaI family transcriptional regulator, penicillinase repressor
MPKTPTISPAEEKVIRLLWRHAPQPAYDIIQSLQQSEGWHANTVRTLLSRLLKKKAVTARRYKNLYLYSPAIDESVFIQAESDSFLERVFGGSVKPMLLHFARRQKLSRKDLEDLKRVLEAGEG